MSGKRLPLASLTTRIALLHEEAAAEIATSKRLHAEAHALLHRMHVSLGELHAAEARSHEALGRNRRLRSLMK
jgi:hypothetical protein